MNPTPITPHGGEVLQQLQETVSASRLGLYLQCRLKFWFRYVQKLLKPKSPSLHLGSAVHAVLKRWNKARWIERPLTLKEAHDAYCEAWADDSEGPVDWQGDEEAEKLTGWRLVDTYLREAHVPAQVKPEAVEVPVEADLARHGLPRLIGVLDLVQEGQIIDYKTSATTPNPDKVAHTTEVQSTSYALLYRHNTGSREAGLQFHHLVKLKNPKVIVTQLPPVSEAQQTRLFRQMEAYVDGLHSGQFVPSPGMHCASCEFFAECSAWS
jgi:putative RecB family exonuclease